MTNARVSRRSAFAAAAGWMAGSRRSVLLGAGDGGPSTGAIVPLYRILGAHLLAPDAVPLHAALQATPVTRHTPAISAYLGRQIAGLSAADACWAARADVHDVTGQVRRGITRARTLLDATATPDVLLILSSSFDGRTDGRTIMLGVNRLGERRLASGVALLAAHEYHHVIRARTAGFASLADAVVAEGLATACSALVEPGRPAWDYLLMSPDDYAWFTPSRRAALWTRLLADVRARRGSHRQRYLDGALAGPQGAPPRAGYLLGYELARAWLSRGYSLATLTRMPTEALWVLAERGDLDVTRALPVSA